MKRLGVVACVLSMAMLPVHGIADDAKPLFENNFEQAEVGKVPEGFLVLDGEFAVKADGGNKFLELPGAPLDNYGVLFGPAEKSDVAVTARINGTGKGRRFPTFGVGLSGQGGFRLQVAPAKKALELYKGDDLAASAVFEWKSGEWTNLKLQITKSGAVWKVEGKAWQGGAEPAQPTISYDSKEEPNEGRASIWGSPISGTPIQFDDLVLKTVAAGK